uniref:Wings apart-like protein homolog n=1 Tax=Gouania willdenowi TaxID=441366 RepID=A0A8C5NE80_GOUWI
MTSRFGKTYNRKGGEANSKFEEVFSNKKPSLSTKWGETTYKAQLGGKRPLLNADVSDATKRPKLDDSDIEDDPFGFDSDDESQTVTSYSVPSTKVGERIVATPTPVADSSVATAVTPALSSTSSTYLIMSCSLKKHFPNRSHGLPSSNTASSYKDQTFSLSQRFVPTSSVDSSALLFTDAPSGSRDPQASSGYDDQLLDFKNEGSEPATETPPAPVENIPPSPFTLRPSNCKKYQRPTRYNLQSSESFENNGNNKSTEQTTKPAAKSAGRGGGGRVRDYTVLHPSCQSVCNVTIQDSMERSMDELVSPVIPSDVGEAGKMKKKSDVPAPKPSRFRPTQTKTKKTKSKTESKLEFFGFEEEGDQESEEGSEGHKSSYKIKYFGFDDLSESDSDDESCEAKAKKAKKTAAALAALSSSVDSPHTSDSQDSQASSSTDAFDFSDDPSPGGTDVQKGRSGKSGDKSKDTCSGLKKIFSGPKKVLDCVSDILCLSLALYTVVQHVKHFNDVVEFGENQEFTDDFEYLETGLKSSQPLNTRCLSVISLAARCAMPSFRMHLRARGKVAQVFKMLNDAPQHPNLALCTASLMYILSRDRLNMDLDRACLELMIKLLEMDQDCSGGQEQLTAKEVAKVKEKIRKLCETVHNKHLDLENITTGHLAMETLLSLTSKRAGDWFKEELRLLGGLDHIVDKVKECALNLSQEDDKENLVASLWGAERCLRVLESVTVQNPENQGYLIAYKDSELIISSARALRYCEDMIQRYSRALNNSSVSLSSAALPHCSFSNVGKAVEDCMRAVIGVLLNLTHDNEWGSTKTGEQDQLILTALNCVLRVPRYIPQEQRFDVRVLGLGLLINLVEYSSRNRHHLVDMEYVSDDTCLEDSLMQPADFFLERERAAILAEAKTDNIITEAPKPALDKSGEWQETSGEIQWVAAEPNDNQTEKKEEEEEEEDQELDLNKALQHAGKHMEDSIVASYTALLLGCLCQGSQINVTTVRQRLPKGDFSIMTEMLKKFLSFMNLTCAMGTTGQKSISRVIDYLEHC